jgi:hypothetical protein
MDKKLDLNGVGNEAVEPGNPTRKTTLKSVVDEDNDNGPMTARQANALLQDIKRLADMTADMGSVLLKEDGTLVDLSDREGRERLERSVNLNTEMGTRMMKAIPSSVTAELCDKDRNLMERFYKDRKAFILTLLSSAIITGMLTCVALFGIVSNRNRSGELEEWYRENRTAIEFGYFIRQEDPSLWKYWQSGRWKDDVAVRDSIHRNHLMKGWGKDIIEE